MLSRRGEVESEGTAAQRDEREGAEPRQDHRQLVVHDLGPAARNRLTRLPERVVFVAAAADGAHGAAVGEDHHFGADALRRRPGGGHDRHQRRRLAALQRVDDRGEDFAIHL